MSYFREATAELVNSRTEHTKNLSASVNSQSTTASTPAPPSITGRPPLAEVIEQKR